MSLFSKWREATTRADEAHARIRAWPTDVWLAVQAARPAWLGEGHQVAWNWAATVDACQGPKQTPEQTAAYLKVAATLDAVEHGRKQSVFAIRRAHKYPPQEDAG